MRLEKDLYAIDKKLLVKAGNKITRKVLNEVAGLSGKVHYVPIKDKWIMKDLIQTFKDKRYAHILYPPETNKKIIRSIHHMKMPEKILSELAFMKKLSPYTYHHVLVIAILAAKISFDHSIKSRFAADKALLLSLFHDLGKSRIPLSILDKPTPITLYEREILSSHPLIGYVLLHYYFGHNHKNYSFSSFQHHERLDGSGYPLGIKTLNKYSQLIGVVDALDALISERPYRSKPFSLRAAIDLLLEEAEKGRFNKSLVRTLIVYSRKKTPGTKIIIGERGRDKAPVDNSYGKTASS
ncbi:MAG: HD domain-containing protein [Syntrophaceae bacterium]|nr:HD domain-containing protein [Syntrophaceae bacterium]